MLEAVSLEGVHGVAESVSFVEQTFDSAGWTMRGVLVPLRRLGPAPGQGRAPQPWEK